MDQRRRLPDLDVSLRDARDFIGSTQLARRALQSRWKAFPIVLHDLIEVIYRLVQSCHLPEFTDHGLPHLCSLVDRIDQWQLPTDPQRESVPRYWLETAKPDRCAILLVATLLHDLGMLSQVADDLPDDETSTSSPSAWTSTADWVRATHVVRLPKLARRVLRGLGHDRFVRTERFSQTLSVACAHNKWPWQWDDSLRRHNIHGLAAILAVADLVDEDSGRCDVRTLMSHRRGTSLNCAHWLRHGLTHGRIMVESGVLSVTMRRPPQCDNPDLLRPIYCALRNHFRLVELYQNELRSQGANITNVEFHPSTGVPLSEADSLSGWNDLPGFSNCGALSYHLLTSFWPEALGSAERLATEDFDHLCGLGLEDVDIRLLQSRMVPADSNEKVPYPLLSEERVFYAILEGES